MGKLYAMGATPSSLSARAKRHELMVEKMQAQLGLTEKDMGRWQAMAHFHGMDQEPQISKGSGDVVYVKGEEYLIENVHKDGSGDDVYELVRPVGGGRYRHALITAKKDGRYVEVMDNFRARR